MLPNSIPARRNVTYTVTAETEIPTACLVTVTAKYAGYVAFSHIYHCGSYCEFMSDIELLAKLKLFAYNELVRNIPLKK